MAKKTVRKKRAHLAKLEDAALKTKLEKHFANVRTLLDDSNISAIVLADGQTFKGKSK